MQRALAFGGRRFNNEAFVFAKLDAVHAQTPIGLLIHGACPNSKDKYGNVIWSADLLAEEWAKSREIPYCGWPAKWKTGGRGPAEGPIRNQLMLDSTRPTLGVEFPGAKGSADMRERLVNAGIHVR